MRDKAVSKKLAEKELLFCIQYAKLLNIREASAFSGISEKKGTALLLRPEVKREIEKQSERLRLRREAETGFRRLAFGSSADAVSLLYSKDETDISRLQTMDLFNISEIKRAKNDTLEIKFFDRHKALERLLEISNASAGEDTKAFYEALDKGAKAIPKPDETV